MRAIVLLLMIAGCSKTDDRSSPGTTASSALASAKPSSEVPCREDGNRSVALGSTTSGKVSSCILAKDFTIDGYECVSGKMIEMVPTTGKLKGCYLKTAKVLDGGWSCQDGLSLYPSSGKLRRCKVTVTKSAGEGIDVRAGDWITVYEGGGIKRLELASGANKVQGYPCKGYLNFFHENGTLKKCELSEDATIEGKKVSAKADGGAAVFVCFDDKGKRVPDCSTLTGVTLD